MPDRPAIYLTPKPVYCYEHTKTELTDQVRQEVEAIRVANVSYVDAPAPRPFEVSVACPGTAAGQSHRVTVEGTYR